ncbi:MAG: LuxR C-terminal-related transcriptional regulator [Clostridiales bacterium]|jgi:LuxR family maltose regulon positive regulatory protein|nr:LuxR C-terminal-related transcriptional regulator [Clostridiales bacterium]
MGAVEITKKRSFVFNEDAYMPRPRIDAKIADSLAESNFVMLCAGAGFGKSTAVFGFLKPLSERVVWLILTSYDNLRVRFWETFSFAVELRLGKEFGDRLRELNFPVSEDMYDVLNDILEEVKALWEDRFFLVIDNMSDITNSEVILLLSRITKILGRNVIIITRVPAQYQLNGSCTVIDEDDLRFTNAEVLSFFYGMAINSDVISEIYAQSNGWALALSMFRIAFSNVNGNNYHAMSLTRSNLRHFFENEVFNTLGTPIQKKLVVLSLAEGLPISFARSFLGAENFLYITSFIRYNSETNTLELQDMFRAFLRAKLDVLDENDKRVLYLEAAQYCKENGLLTDSFRYFAKLRDFGALSDIILNYPLMLPYDLAEFFLKTLEEIPTVESDLLDDLAAQVQKTIIPRLYMEMRRLDEAERKCYASINEYKNIEVFFSSVVIFSNYNTLGFINMFTATATHEYKFHEYFKLAFEYRKKYKGELQRALGSYKTSSIGSYVCPVGVGARADAYEILIEASRQAVKYITQTVYGLYSGYDCLVGCEYHFYRKEMERAKALARAAIIQGGEYAQYEIEARAVFYLIRVALLEGDAHETSALITQLKELGENKNFFNRQACCGMLLSWVHVHMREQGQVVFWIRKQTGESGLGFRMERLERLIKAKLALREGRNLDAISISNGNTAQKPEGDYLLFSIESAILRSVAYYRLGCLEDASGELSRAIRVAEPYGFMMPFIESGADMSSLFKTINETELSCVSEEFRNGVKTFSSIYGKKYKFVCNALNETQDEDKLKLSTREHEILTDIYHGLSRAEIATNRYISINTVKTALQMIYSKLGAKNNVVAVRIAQERGLL